jgi:hypothetical protein
VFTPEATSGDAVLNVFVSAITYGDFQMVVPGVIGDFPVLYLTVILRSVGIDVASNTGDVIVERLPATLDLEKRTITADMQGREVTFELKR